MLPSCRYVLLPSAQSLPIPRRAAHDLRKDYAGSSVQGELHVEF